MSRVIEITEYQATPCELSEIDVRFLVESFPGKISISRRPGESRYLVDPGPRVGIIELPSGQRLRCNPKVPVANIFFMLATAERIASPFHDQTIGFERIDEIFDFLVEHLANLVEGQMVRGLYRTYVDREENLTAVRGRILIADDLRQNSVMRHRTYCQFSEFTWDVPENRVIRQTIFALCRLVRRSDLKQRLLRLDRQLGEVDPTPLPLATFDRFTYHRLNAGYVPIHRLCRLLLQAASVSEHLGDFGFKAFLIDMNQLYEQFVTESLRERVNGSLTVVGQYSSTLDVGKQVATRPDIVLLRDGRPAFIADCKYKRIASGEFRNADLYQLLAYCTAEGLPRGALIYPRTEAVPFDAAIVRNSPIEIRHLYVDLGAVLPDLRTSLDAVARNVAHLAQLVHRAA